MARNISDIAEEALALPEASRVFLIEKLLETLSADAPLSDEWRTEVQRRCAELDAGAETYPAEQVLAELRGGVG